MKEYITEKDERQMNSKEYDKHKTLAFGYKFKVPNSMRDHRSDEPFKTVKTEYLIVSLMSLVGNVGGTLGLFIGFSFATTFELIMDVLQKLWKNLKGSSTKERKIRK